MSDELAKIQQVTGTITKYDDSIFDDIASSGDYLPRVQLYGGNSKATKRGDIPIGHWGIAVNKDTIVPLGDSVDCLPLAWRPKALMLTEGNIINFYEPSNPEFQKIKAASSIRDSGAMYGPEFLLWLPGIKKFVTLFSNNKTMRRAANSLKDLIGTPATLKSKFIDDGQYSWHGPEYVTCSTPFEMPKVEDVQEQKDKFINVTDSTVEVAAPEAVERAR